MNQQETEERGLGKECHGGNTELAVNLFVGRVARMSDASGLPCEYGDT